MFELCILNDWWRQKWLQHHTKLNISLERMGLGNWNLAPVFTRWFVWFIFVLLPHMGALTPGPFDWGLRSWSNEIASTRKLFGVTSFSRDEVKPFWNEGILAILLLTFESVDEARGAGLQKNNFKSALKNEAWDRFALLFNGMQITMEVLFCNTVNFRL